MCITATHSHTVQILIYSMYFERELIFSLFFCGCALLSFDDPTFILIRIKSVRPFELWRETIKGQHRLDTYFLHKIDWRNRNCKLYNFVHFT